MKFIDLFSGCGGLSLGLSRAGWKGVFAIEKNPDAFSTFKHNLIDKKDSNLCFSWPKWLPCKPMTTSELLKGYSTELKELNGKIDLIAGGPPCQGFSFAGKRNPNDPRNRLTEEYIQLVKTIKPKYLLLENVKGFNSAFKGNGEKQEKVYAKVVEERLNKAGYIVFPQMINSSLFGVPQPRPRFIMIAFSKDLKITSSPFDMLEAFIPEYRKSRGLDPKKDTTVHDAISDLETAIHKIKPCTDSKGFMQIDYKPKRLSKYQKLMRDMCNKSYLPDSLRLAKHKEETLKRFENILKSCEKGKSVKKEVMLALGTKKQCFTPLHPNKMSRTITTLPDDLLHYSEPRILTVRENARIQSFPDWFEFKGKYTTGGSRRKEECPRYTQVGNAVPPLMAEGLGLLLIN